MARFVDGVVDKLFLHRDHRDRRVECIQSVRDAETLAVCGCPPQTCSRTTCFPSFPVVGRTTRRSGRWKIAGKELSELLGSESFPEFLRVFWNSRHRLVRKADLFKTIRDAIGDKAGAFKLVRDLDRQARVYAGLRAPETGSWTPQERDSLTQLQMFNVRQPLSVLLAVFERFAEADRAGFRALSACNRHGCPSGTT